MESIAGLRHLENHFVDRHFADYLVKFALAFEDEKTLDFVSNFDFCSFGFHSFGNLDFGNSENFGFGNYSVSFEEIYF